MFDGASEAAIPNVEISESLSIFCSDGTLESNSV